MSIYDAVMAACATVTSADPLRDAEPAVLAELVRDGAATVGAEDQSYEATASVTIDTYTLRTPEAVSEALEFSRSVKLRHSAAVKAKHSYSLAVGILKRCVNGDTDGRVFFDPYARASMAKLQQAARDFAQRDDLFAVPAPYRIKASEWSLVRACQVDAPYNGLRALVPTDVYIVDHVADTMGPRWAAVVNKGECAKLRCTKQLTTVLDAMGSPPVRIISLDPGEILITHPGMPLKCEPADDTVADEDFVVQAVVFGTKDYTDAWPKTDIEASVLHEEHIGAYLMTKYTPYADAPPVAAKAKKPAATAAVPKVKPIDNVMAEHDALNARIAALHERERNAYGGPVTVWDAAKFEKTAQTWRDAGKEASIPAYRNALKTMEGKIATAESDFDAYAGRARVVTRAFYRLVIMSNGAGVAKQLKAYHDGNLRNAGLVSFTAQPKVDDFIEKVDALWAQYTPPKVPDANESLAPQELVGRALNEWGLRLKPYAKLAGSMGLAVQAMESADWTRYYTAWRDEYMRLCVKSFEEQFAVPHDVSSLMARLQVLSAVFVAPPPPPAQGAPPKAAAKKRERSTSMVLEERTGKMVQKSSKLTNSDDDDDHEDDDDELQFKDARAGSDDEMDQSSGDVEVLEDGNVVVLNKSKRPLIAADDEPVEYASDGGDDEEDDADFDDDDDDASSHHHQRRNGVAVAGPTLAHRVIMCKVRCLSLKESNKLDADYRAMGDDKDRHVMLNGLVTTIEKRTHCWAVYRRDTGDEAGAKRFEEHAKALKHAKQVAADVAGGDVNAYEVRRIDYV